MNRRYALFAPVFLVVLAGATVAAIILGKHISSTRQKIANAAPPTHPSMLTALVTRRVLSEAVVVEGKGIPVRSTDVYGGRPAPGGTRAMVTGLAVAPGSKAVSGMALMEISGRPAFLFAGAVPSYRDLTPGVSGRDVSELQTALRALGFPPGPEDGVFGPLTQTALSRFYRSRGYEPQPFPAVPGAAAGLATSSGAGVAGTPPPQYELPQAEVVFLPGLPGRVASVPVSVGSPVTGPIARISTGGVTVEAEISAGDARLAAVGESVDLRPGSDAPAVPGHVTAVRPSPAGGGRVRVTVAGNAPLDLRLAGAPIRMSIRAATTGTARMVVPLSALSAGADGTSRVVVLRRDGRQVPVPVRVDLVAGGYASVTPTAATRRPAASPGLIAPGDRVVIGS